MHVRVHGCDGGRDRKGSPLLMPCSHAAVKQRAGVTVQAELQRRGPEGAEPWEFHRKVLQRRLSSAGTLN